MVADAALMNEMNADPVHGRAKLREPVYRLLLSTPIERSAPVFDQAAQLPVICSECPSVLDLIRPPRSRQTILKVVQGALRYVDYELVDTHHSAPGAVPPEIRANCMPGLARRI